jgi:dCTP deaminase
MILRDATIRSLCISPLLALTNTRPMIEPFIERTAHESGLTGGLSGCGYDVHIKDGMTLWPGDFALGVTVERFVIPTDVVARVYNKSTLARIGLSMPTTVAEPGWEGWLTLELKNTSASKIRIQAGQPIGQVMFERLDGHAEGYDGRYQNQGPEPQSALFIGRS